MVKYYNYKLQMFLNVFLAKSYMAKLIPVAIGPLIQFILKPLKKPCLMPSALKYIICLQQ